MAKAIDNIESLREINSSIKFFANRKRYYEAKERAFAAHRLDLLTEKMSHEVDIATASIRRLGLRRDKLYQLLN